MVEKAESMPWLSWDRAFLHQPDAHFSIDPLRTRRCCKGRKTNPYIALVTKLDNSFPKMIPSDKSPTQCSAPPKGPLSQEMCCNILDVWMQITQRYAELPEQCNGSTAERQLPSVKVEKSVCICWVYLILPKLVPMNTKGKRGGEEKEEKKG